MRKWFKEIREKKGLTQMQFAEILSVSHQLIGKIENGGNIRVSTAKDLGEKMRIKWYLFFEDYDKQLADKYSNEEDDLKFLKKLQKEIKDQPHDGQAAPRFWAIGDIEERVTAEGYEDKVVIYDPFDAEDYTLDEVVSRLKDIKDGKEDMLTDTPELRESLDEDLEEIELDIQAYGEPDLDDIIRMYQEYIGGDPRVIYASRDHVVKTNTMFITKQGAKDHLKLNDYHYTKEAHTYAMTAWRAPKVERLWKILENFDWSKVNLQNDKEKVLSEIIEYFEEQQGYDINEVIADIVHETNLIKVGEESIDADECSIEWGDDYCCNLDEFVEKYTEELLNKVVNVVKSFKEE